MESTTETILITGNTYPVKDQLKGLGGRWSKEQKGWLVPKSREAEARKLVTGVPAPIKPTTKPTAVRVCADCGKGGRLVVDLEDGMLKHYNCCDMPPQRY